jgi:hypothetical protein
LHPENALAAWKKAVEKAHGAVVTAKLVKQAVAEIVELHLPKPQRVSAKPRPAGGFTKKLVEALNLVGEVEGALHKKEDPKTVFDLLTQLRKCLKTLKISQRQTLKQRGERGNL